MALDQRIADLEEYIRAMQNEVNDLKEIQAGRGKVFSPDKYVFLPVAIGDKNVYLPLAKEM